MKTWKMVFIVFGIFLVLSVISGMAYLCKPQKNAPNMQSDGARHAGWAGQCETQEAGLNSKSQIPNPTLEKEEFAQKTQKLQMPFVANKGQVDEQVEFYAKTFGGTVFVTKDGEIVYALPKTEKSGVRSQNTEDRSQNVGWDAQGETQQAANPQSKNPSNSPNPKSETAGIAIREEFVGARVKTIQGEDPSITKVNYFKGSDPSKWKTDVSTYDFVNLGEIYKGIELRLKAYGDNVEKLFCVKPGANPEQIKISLSGIQPPESPFIKGDGIHNSSCKWGTAEKPRLDFVVSAQSNEKEAKGLWVNEHGQLVAETELGPVKFTRPVAYQEIDGKRVEVDVEYKVES